MNSHKILITDNEPKDLNIIDQILIKSKRNYEILNALDSKTTLEIIKNEKPDLLITDWDMPEINGIELINIIQKLPSDFNIPIIVCSGVKIKTEDLADALNAGAIDFIRKPVDPLELLARVNSMLRIADTSKLLIREQENRFLFEKQILEEKLDIQNREINTRILILSKYNELLRSTTDLLRKFPPCVNSKQCKPHFENIITNISSSLYNDSWEQFILSFEKLYPSFFTRVADTHKVLTQNELKLCALLRLGLSTKEISTITQQTNRAVEIARYRLRKKLNISKGETIDNYLLEY